MKRIITETCTNSIMYPYYARGYKNAIKEIAKYELKQKDNEFPQLWDCFLNSAKRDLIRYKAGLKEYIFNVDCDWVSEKVVK